MGMVTVTVAGCQLAGKIEMPFPQRDIHIRSSEVDLIVPRLGRDGKPT